MKANAGLNRRPDGLIRRGYIWNLNVFIFYFLYILNETKNPSIKAENGLKTAKMMKGDEGLNFTVYPQIPFVYRHSGRKDEG